MNKKKYFFFDIDGTLTDRQTGQIVPSAALAIEQLKAAGHFVSLATGRALYKADVFRRAHGFEHMVCNGGHGIVFDNDIKENRPLDFDKAYAVYQQAEDLGLGCWLALDDSKKVYAKSFLFYDQVGLRKEPSTYIIDADFDPRDWGTIYKLYVAVDKEHEHLLTSKKDLGHLRFERDYLMFQPDEKLAGILRMLDYAGGQPEDVVVFGDDYNDLVMFDQRFYKVAMGNGCAELKAKADLVAPANIDDGIYKVCQDQGWIAAGLDKD